MFGLFTKVKYSKIEIGEYFVCKGILYLKHQWDSQQITGWSKSFGLQGLPTKVFQDNTKVEPR